MFDLAELVAMRGFYAPPERYLDPGVSPLLGNFTGLPPLLFQVGSLKVLLVTSNRDFMMFATSCNKSALARPRKCGSNHGTSIQLANAGNRYLAHQQLGSAKVQGMNVPTSDPAIGPSAIPVTGADASPCKTVAVLQELLTQSIHLRDLYKNARWQFSGIEFRDLRQMLDHHYKEQLSVIDVLVDRIRNLGGAARVFAGDFLQRTQFCHALRGRIAPKRLLRELLEAHETQPHPVD